MVKRIIGIGVIYLGATIAWIILGGTTLIRTNESEDELTLRVSDLWGEPQTQLAPQFFTQTGPAKEPEKEMHALFSSNIQTDMRLEHRRKGLLWYPTYKVTFDATYQIKNETAKTQDFHFDYRFPSQSAIYDNFLFTVDGVKRENLSLSGGGFSEIFPLQPNEIRTIRIRYHTQGMKTWVYKLGNGVEQVRNFQLQMQTDFDQVDFPAKTVSPTQKTVQGKGWKLSWKYETLLADVSVGMLFPQKLNPGPWVAKVTFFAPVSLFLFFFVLFIISVIRNVDIHPMNYFFLAASFFSFHLLLAYLVDQISIEVALLISSAVSVALVISYMRLVTGIRFALMEVGITQLVYLVLFSYTFFWEAHVGLAITILSILTLFIVMQMTGRINWNEVFQKPKTT